MSGGTFLKKRYFLLVFIFFGLLLNIHSVSAATVNYYVDPSGTDDGSHGTGTGTDAWATIEYAVNNVANPTSDTIIINISGDTYTTSNNEIGIDRNFTNLTLQGAGAMSTIVQPATSPSTASARNFNIGYSEYVTFKNMTIRYGRLTSGSGPAIAMASSGQLTLERCIVDDNDTTGSMANGGISSGSTVIITNSTISNNYGPYVGGLALDGGNSFITNSTFYNNTGTYGGNIGVGYHAYVTLTNNTITKGGDGVAIFNSAFYGIYMKNNIIYAPDSGYSLDLDGYTAKVFGSNNIIKNQDASYFTDGVDGNHVGTSLNVGLADDASYNGASTGTKTFALSSDSIAIDAGTTAANNGQAVPSVDQRGKDRYNGLTDIGSFEYRGADEADPLIISLVKADNDNYVDLTINEGIYNTDGGSGGVEASDFSVVFTQGIGDATGASITSVSKVDNGALTGGEATIRLHLSITGTSRGVETLAIQPASNTSIYDAAGNPMYTDQVSNTVTLGGAFEYYVRADGDDANDGSANDAANAWLTIQHAIDTVANPTTAPIIIYISGDTYITGNDDINIDRNFTDLTLQGAGTTSTIIKPHADPASATDGNFTIGYSEYVAMRDLTIRDGYDTGGGPAISMSSGGQLTLENCLIDDNDSDVYSSMRNAGISSSSSVIMDNCTVSNNDGDYSGGLTLDGGTSYITNSTFYNNTGRYAGNIGIGYHVYATITNCTITQGSGGIEYFNSGFYGVYLENNIVYDTSGYSLDLDSNTSKVHGSNNIIKNQYRTYFTDGVDGNHVGTSLTVDLDAGGLADNSTLNGTQTVSIGASSIAINSGTSTANNGKSIPGVDQRGAARVGLVDIGAFEYGGVPGAPALNSSYPVDGDSDIATDTNIVLTFSEAVDAEAGADNDIVIKLASNDSTIETIDAQDAKVTGSGTAEITINPAATLSENTAYYVLIGADAFDDTDSNSYPGISDATSLNFTTVDATAPNVSVLSPANDATGVAVDANLVITFDEAVDAESGNIKLYKYDGTLVEAFDVTADISGSGTTEITINPAANLQALTEYYVQIDASAFDDASSNSYIGISDTTSWDFTTAGTAGITVGAISGSTTEAGGTATYTVVLDTEPIAEVTISVNSNDSGEGVAAPGTLTFTSANWSTPQTVTITGQDDDLDDGNQAYSILMGPSSSVDSNYDNISLSNIGVTNQDNDTAGVSVGAISGSTTEAGGTANFSVRLNTEPTGTVVINTGSDDPSEGTVSGGGNLSFSSVNWNVPQMVTITGVDDQVDDGDISYQVTVQMNIASTEDSNYDAIDPNDVTVTNTDDDTAGVTLSESTQAVTEGGISDTYTVVLDTKPTNDVSIVFNDAADQVTISPATLTFTSANWSTPQTVTITAVDDSIDDSAGDTVSHSASSIDSNYNGISINNVAVTVTDNDNAGITTTGTDLSLTEGENTTYSLVLNTEPSSNVTITPSTTGQVTVSSALIFTSANWDTAQTVTVTAVDDSDVEGDHSDTVSHTVSSSDSNYNSYSLSNLTISITDNDQLTPEIPDEDVEDEPEIIIDKEEVGGLENTIKGKGKVTIYENDNSTEHCTITAWPSGGAIGKFVQALGQDYVAVVKNKYGSTIHIYDLNCNLVEKKKLSPRLHPRQMVMRNFIGGSGSQEIAVGSRRGSTLYLKMFRYNPNKDEWYLLRVKTFRPVPSGYSLDKNKNGAILIKDKKGNILYKYRVNKNESTDTKIII